MRMRTLTEWADENEYLEDEIDPCTVLVASTDSTKGKSYCLPDTEAYDHPAELLHK
jgi:hypothetical protein